MRRSSEISVLRSVMARWMSMAQRTASTALANSTRAPSPVVLTMRPRFSATLGSMKFASMCLKRREGTFLVDAHQSAVSGNVSREDGGQPPFDTRFDHKCGPPCRDI